MQNKDNPTAMDVINAITVKELFRGFYRLFKGFLKAFF
jgi:hypothetical protein